jgi:exopolysaccharide biosynthesis polyprenyl glycosylphosphotransferase
MLDRSRHPSVFLLAAADLAVAALSLYLAYLIRATVLPRISSVWGTAVSLYPTFALLLIGTVPLLLASLYFARGYDLARLRSTAGIAISVARAFAFSTLAVFAFAYVLRDQTFSRAIVAAYLLLSMFGFFLVRLLARDLARLIHAQGIGLRNAVIVGTGPAAQSMADLIQRRPYLGLSVTGMIAVPDEREADQTQATLGSIESLPDLVDREVVDTVIFAISLDEAARYEKVIWKLEEVGTTVHMRGDAIGVLLSRTFIGEFEGMPILTLKSTPADPIALALKRTIDVAGALFGLTVLLPVFAATAIAIRLASRGPLFYHQERVGLAGRRFKMHKFRSMYPDAERRLHEVMSHNEMTGPVFKMTNDPRITPVGRWIRKFSVDELPQLWNVLVGEMSLVGPRPPLPREVEQYERWQRRRLSMKPGITCLWQVSGRNDIDFETWMKLDMEYIDNWSLGLDLKILFKTIPVVLLAKGAK